MTGPVADRSTPGVKVHRIIGQLEKLYGIPEQPPRRTPPLDMLIATILSQNTNDLNSARAYASLRKKFPRWEDVLGARRNAIASAIRTGGMADQKSASIKGVLAGIQKRFGTLDLSVLSGYSDDEIFELLTAFDGVGTKTASCVLLFSLRRNIFPVDTHVHRITGRLGLNGNSATPDKTFAFMRPIIPPGKAYSFHINLILFGRKICSSARPHCNICPLYRECTFPGKEMYRDIVKPGRPEHAGDFMLLDNV